MFDRYFRGAVEFNYATHMVTVSNRTMQLREWNEISSCIERIRGDIGNVSFSADYRDDVCRWQIGMKIDNVHYAVFVDDPEERLCELITEIKLKHF
jgi:hypothetical protein